MPTKTWVVGEEVLAADFNSFVQKQVVATFANAAARDVAIPAPTPGMMVWLTDLAALQVRTGTVWRSLPYGQLGYSEMTANSGGVQQTPAPSALNLTVTIPGGARRVRASAAVPMQYAAGSGATHLRAAIYQDGASIAQAMQYLPGAVSYATLTVERVVAPSAGSHTFQVYVWGDSGTALIAASPTAPATLTVTDIGGP